MATIQVNVNHPNGRREVIDIEGQRALIGSGSHCDVRLPMEDAAHEHLVIEAVGAVLRAEARADEPPTLIDGMPLTLAPLAPGAVLKVGKLELRVRSSGELGAGQALGKERSGASPITLLALGGALLAAASLLFADDGAPIAPPPSEVPRLFSSTPPSCPPGEGARALAMAEEQLAMADGKRERMPFAIEDGVGAVTFYGTAAACFRRGGDPRRATEAEEAARSLERDLTDELRTRSLRLSHLLTVQDYELARGDVQVLRALSSGKQGKYVEWLSTVSKQLAQKGVR